MAPREKQPRWENTKKCYAEALSALLLLYRGLIGRTFRRGRPWPNYGSDKSAPLFHTTPVEIILVRILVNMRLAFNKRFAEVSAKH